MVKLYSPKALAIIISVICFSSLQAQTFKLLKDINALTNSNPANATNKSSEYAVLNGKAYFAADDGIHGQELWSSDGTEAGTKLVKDINPGAVGSHVSNIYAYKNKIYFFSSNDGITSKLYTSDGTAAGTTILRDSMGVTGFQPFINTQFAVLNDILLFTASNPFVNEEIWRTDGTKEGTSRLFGLNTPEYNYNYLIDNFTLFNGKLYFTRGFTPGGELWCSDGTAAGTHKFNYTNQKFSNVEHLAVAGNTLYINAGGFFLFKTNGDSASTAIIKTDFDPAINNIIVFKNELYCNVWGSAHGAIGIFKYNPASADGLTLFKSSVTNVTGFAGNANDSMLYFTITTSDTSKPGLWATNGSSTVKLLEDNNSFDYSRTFGGKLYFQHLGNDKGIELWVSDGSVAGTKMVADINPGIYHSWPSSFTAVGNKILFAANTNTNGYELWGLTGANAALVKDINKTSTASSAPQIYGHVYDTINNRLFFWAGDGIHGYEPWTTDGTPGGTGLLKDIGPGPISGDGYNTYSPNLSGYGLYNLPGGVRLSNYSYFFASATKGYALYKTQGTPATTSVATNFDNRPGGIYPRWMTGFNKKIFTLISVGRSTAQLYVYDGATAPVLVKDSFLIPFGWGGMVSAGNYMYFFVDLNPGLELWRTDGTAAGTALVKRLYPEQDIFSPVYGYAVSNKKDLFFITNSGTGKNVQPGYDNNKNYLWKTDGTTAGTIMLKKLPVINEQPVVNNNKVYFVGNDAATGRELWVTDGTTEGTKLVKDITPGTGGSNVYSLLSFKGYLYFHADGPGGSGIWKTDGTDTGTTLVFKGTTNYIKGNDELYYVLNNRIWHSDGTSAGSKIMDTTSLEGLTPNNLLFANNRLYFTATNYAYGQELYTTSEKLLPVTLLNFSGNLKGNDALLNWQTANELHNDYFNVQRSTTGGGFTTIGRVQAKTGTDNNYNFTDAGVTALGADKLYYRLQQADLDGKNEYSKTIQLDVVKGALLKVWPNPATSFATVTSSINMPGAVIQLVDATGHTVYTGKHSIPAGGSVTIPLQGYAKGVYTVTVQQKGMQKQEYKVAVE